MSNRRILSIWFPRLGAERLIRRQPMLGDRPVAVVEEHHNMQVITSLNGMAQADGLQIGQPVRDAHAMCPGLLTFPRSPQGETQFLEALQRWASRFSPWVAPEDEDALVVDLTGCAHLFGGEERLMQVVQDDCTDLGLSALIGLADTRGAAWALARYAGKATGSDRSGDSIDQEARATRSRAGKRRHWTKGGSAPAVTAQAPDIRRIAQPGQTYSALSPLPIAALRLEPDMTAQLGRLGLRRVGDLLGQPRAGLARRFGRGVVLRLDQAMGSAPEPVSPAKPPDHFAVRMTLPDPIGLVEDVMAAIDRVLPRLCKMLEDKGKGTRQVMLQAYRSDHAVEMVEVGLARPSHDPHRIRPLLEMKIEDIDAGFGIDMIRLLAVQVEPVHDAMTVGHREAGAAVQARLNNANAMDDLIGRLGARVGLDAIRRFEPVDSHIPEKSHKIMAAAWSKPHKGPWPRPTNPRPLLLWHPEPVHAPATPELPETFRWRGMDLKRHRAIGPERIAPEWWLDDPNWRSGTRDYWIADTEDGQRLWLFYAHGAAMSPGWFCQGSFA
ncbi:DNA polymerase Y family protein [uncultured Tateyamaria sp.]|uniref:Y-family DNA polymerase n=1 Tax=uncultured Tateyamaria sp. TaxID=455651 RepID=UPI002610DB98|nr:DNA polymerase Y family protein [uncultured Tateyamaria sp.]